MKATRRHLWRRAAALGCGVVVGFLCISALRHVASNVGRWDGRCVGCRVGSGFRVGMGVGLRVGRLVGSPTATGAFVGLRVGLFVGSCVGLRVPCVGRGVGRFVGFMVEGFCVGRLVSSGSRPLSALNFRSPDAATWPSFGVVPAKTNAGRRGENDVRAKS